MTPAKSSILVGMDFSLASERVLATAVDLAQRLAVGLHVVHVFEPLVAVAADAPHSYLNVEACLDEGRLHQRNQCTEICERIVADRVPYDVHIVDAMALDGLLESIEKLKPELVIVGSHGRGAVMRMLLGSVSTALCRHSPVPVVVVPSVPQAESVEPGHKPASTHS